MIHFETQTLDLAAEDRVETILVGLRYTGPESTASPRRARDSGGWPGRSIFQGGDPGRIQLGVVPDTIDQETVEGGSLAGLESLADFDVVYDPAELASAILEENYLPPSAFGGERQAPNYDVREAVFETLGLDEALGTAPEAEDKLREALAEVAGMDLSEDEAAPDAERERTYAEEYSRGHLYRACNALGMEVNWNEASKRSLAENLATRSPPVAEEALEATEDGEADLTDEYGDDDSDEDADE